MNTTREQLEQIKTALEDAKREVEQLASCYDIDDYRSDLQSDILHNIDYIIEKYL